MKKLVYLILVITILVVAVGCGSGDEKEKASSGPSETAVGQTGRTDSGSGEKPLRTTSEGTSVKESQKDSQPVNNDEGIKKGLGTKKEDDTNNAATENSKSALTNNVQPKHESQGEGSQAALWVTQDFSSSVLLDKQIAVDRNISVLDIIKANLEVDTAYGGGFINAINGLQSGYTGKLFGGKKMDWFYWVNGIMVAEGAGDYIPMSGDRIWWDYHDWGSGSFVTAVVGAYPQPFVNGFDGRNEGTLVAYAPGSEAQAEKAAGALRRQGAPRVTVSALSGVDPAKRSKMTVVVGLWPELEKESFFADMNENSRKTGIYVDFAKDSFTALDYERNEAGVYKAGTGALVATGRGLGDRNPLWLITGVDTAGLNSAVNIISDSPAQLSRKVGVLVTGGRVKALPVTN